MKSGAYLALGERPFIICAYGDNPGSVLKKMARLINKKIKEDDTTTVLSLNSSYDEDGIFVATATLSNA
jgi:predicted glutamine amidotransferase